MNKIKNHKILIMCISSGFALFPLLAFANTQDKQNGGPGSCAGSSGSACMRTIYNRSKTTWTASFHNDVGDTGFEWSTIPPHTYHTFYFCHSMLGGYTGNLQLTGGSTTPALVYATTMGWGCPTPFTDGGYNGSKAAGNSGEVEFNKAPVSLTNDDNGNPIDSSGAPSKATRDSDGDITIWEN